MLDTMMPLTVKKKYTYELTIILLKSLSNATLHCFPFSNVVLIIIFLIYQLFISMCHVSCDQFGRHSFNILVHALYTLVRTLVICDVIVFYEAWNEPCACTLLISGCGMLPE